jgi:hypothetical protein
MESTEARPVSVGNWEPGEDWPARVERLQEWVCVLLAKNQMLREALQAERANRERDDSLYDYQRPSSLLV